MLECSALTSRLERLLVETNVNALPDVSILCAFGSESDKSQHFKYNFKKTIKKVKVNPYFAYQIR